MKLCPYCDHMSKDDHFCTGCGKPIHEVEGKDTKNDKQWRENIKKA